MHMMAYHAPEMIRKYGNLRQFSGQGMGTYIAVNYCLYMHIIGVEKNNDDAKHHYYSSNRHDAPKDILLTNTPFTLATENRSDRSGTVPRSNVNGFVLCRTVLERNCKICPLQNGSRI